MTLKNSGKQCFGLNGFAKANRHSDDAFKCSVAIKTLFYTKTNVCETGVRHIGRLPFDHQLGKTVLVIKEKGSQ